MTVCINHCVCSTFGRLSLQSRFLTRNRKTTTITTQKKRRRGKQQKAETTEYIRASAQNIMTLICLRLSGKAALFCRHFVTSIVVIRVIARVCLVNTEVN